MTLAKEADYDVIEHLIREWWGIGYERNPLDNLAWEILEQEDYSALITLAAEEGMVGLAIVDDTLVYDDAYAREEHWITLASGETIDTRTYLVGAYLSKREIERFHRIYQQPTKFPDQHSPAFHEHLRACASYFGDVDDDYFDWLMVESGGDLAKFPALRVFRDNDIPREWTDALHTRLYSTEGAFLYHCGVPADYANRLTAGMDSFSDDNVESSDLETEGMLYPEAMNRLVNFYDSGIPVDIAALFFTKALSVNDVAKLVQEGLSAEYLACLDWEQYPESQNDLMFPYYPGQRIVEETG